MRRFWHDEGGATSIEYALIASLIAMAIIAGASMVGTSLKTSLTSVGSGLVSSR